MQVEQLQSLSKYSKMIAGTVVGLYMMEYIMRSDSRLAKRGRRLIEETFRWMTRGLGSYLIPFRLIFDDDDDDEDSWLDDYDFENRGIVSSMFQLIKKWLYFTLRLLRRAVSNLIIYPLLKIPRDIAWLLYWLTIWLIILKIAFDVTRLYLSNYMTNLKDSLLSFWRESAGVD